MVSMGDMLRPLRLGFGTPYGCEAAVHAARLHLHSSPGSIMVKLDFKNAFNCLRRDKMLTAVQNLASELLPFIFSAYEKIVILFFGNNTTAG